MQSRSAELREEVRWHEQQRLLSDFGAEHPPHAAAPRAAPAALLARSHAADDGQDAGPATARTASPRYAFSDAPVGPGYGGGGPQGGGGAPAAPGRGGCAADAPWSSRSGAREASCGQDGAGAADHPAGEESPWLAGPGGFSGGPSYAPDQQGMLQGGWQPLQPGGQDDGAEGQGLRTLDVSNEGLRKHSGVDDRMEELDAEGSGAHEGFAEGLGERSNGSGAVDAVVEQLQAARAARRDWVGPGAAAAPPYPDSVTEAPAAPDMASSCEAAGAPHSGAGRTSGGADWDARHQGYDGLLDEQPPGEVPPLGYGSGEPGEGGYHVGYQPADPIPSSGAEGAWRGAWGTDGTDGGLRYPHSSVLAHAPPPPPVPRFDRRGASTGAPGDSDPAGEAAGLDEHPGQGFAEAVEAALRGSAALQARIVPTECSGKRRIYVVCVLTALQSPMEVSSSLQALQVLHGACTQKCRIFTVRSARTAYREGVCAERVLRDRQQEHNRRVYC